jgi:hypothetical protein
MAAIDSWLGRRARVLLPPRDVDTDEKAGGTRFFFIAGLLFALTFGAGLGALVLATKTLPASFLGGLSPPAARLAHGHAQVFGFVSLFVMGVALHVVPRLRGLELADPGVVRRILVLQTAGALLAVAGGLCDLGWLNLLAGILLVAGTTAFAQLMLGMLSRGTPTAQHLESYLRAGCLWLVVAALLAVASATPWGASLRAPMWEAALWGFAASWILGMSLRLLPVHLGLESLPGAVADRLWLYYQSAVVVWVGVAVLEAWIPLAASRAVAGVALAAAGGAVAFRLGRLERREGKAAIGAAGFQGFVVASYGWLVLALALGPGAAGVMGAFGAHPPPLLADFARHAFTLGFLTQMIMGVALRVVPIFAGARLWSARLRGTLLVVINLAVALRGLQVAVVLEYEALWPWIALSGVVAFAAFALFTLNLVMSLRSAGAPTPGPRGSKPMPATPVSPAGRTSVP